MKETAYIRQKHKQFCGIAMIEGCICVQTHECDSIADAVRFLNAAIKREGLAIKPLTVKTAIIVNTSQPVILPKPPKKRGRKKKE